MARSITLLYFAAVRDAAGKSEERLDLPDAVYRISDLAAFLEERHPALAGRLASVRFAVNEAFVDASTALVSGDVVAVIPPVSGG